jgi:hypothetical protein
MSAKKIETIFSVLEVIENNVKTAKNLLKQIMEEKGIKVDNYNLNKTPGSPSYEENNALEVVEGYFDGEHMVGDNSQIYPVPQNYASKTQLITGDRMKWILTYNREIFKLIQPAKRRRVMGTFNIEGDNYVVLVDEFPSPIKILKASATYAMKNLDLKVGDSIAVYIPESTMPVWGAFISIVKNTEEKKSTNTNMIQADMSELDSLHEFNLNEPSRYSPDLDKVPSIVKPSISSDDISKKVEDFF